MGSDNDEAKKKRRRRRRIAGKLDTTAAAGRDYHREQRSECDSFSMTKGLHCGKGEKARKKAASFLPSGVPPSLPQGYVWRWKCRVKLR